MPRRLLSAPDDLLPTLKTLPAPDMATNYGPLRAKRLTKVDEVWSAPANGRAALPARGAFPFAFTFSRRAAGSGDFD